MLPAIVDIRKSGHDVELSAGTKISLLNTSQEFTEKYIVKMTVIWYLKNVNRLTLL